MRIPRHRHFFIMMQPGVDPNAVWHSRGLASGFQHSYIGVNFNGEPHGDNVCIFRIFWASNKGCQTASDSSAQLPNEVLVLVGMLLITGPVIANSTASCLLCETREPSFEFLESKKGANQSLDSEHSRSQSTQLVHTNNFVHKIIPGFVHTSFLVVIHAVAKCVSEITATTRRLPTCRHKHGSGRDQRIQSTWDAIGSNFAEVRLLQFHLGDAYVPNANRP